MGGEGNAICLHKQSCYPKEEGWSPHHQRLLDHLLMAVLSGPGLLGHSFSGSVPNLVQPLALVHFSLGEDTGEVLI